MKIKNIFNIIYLEDKIIIGSGSKTVEISPVNNEVQDLVRDLEQGINIDALYEKSAIQKEDIDDFIRNLEDANYIEQEESIDSEYYERNKTNFNFLRNYSNMQNSVIQIQKKIENTRILLLGVGGASILATSLVGMGIQEITLVDYDTVDYGNLNRQFIYSEKDIGKFKTDVAKQFLLNLNRNIKVSTYNLKISGYEDIIGLVEESDIVINAIDTPPIESIRWINYCCLKKQKPLFQMGMGLNTILIESFTYKRGCYDCSLVHQLNEKFDDTSNLLKYIYGTSYHSVNTSYAPNILAGTGLLVMEIFKYILNKDKYLDCNYELELETYTLRRFDKHVKEKNCPTCNSDKTKYLNIFDLIGVIKDEYKNKPQF